MSFKSQLRITFEINENYWDELVSKSIESSPFLKSDFLRSIGFLDSRVLVFENEVPIFGTCLITPSVGDFDDKHAFTAYQGIFFPNLLQADYSDENEKLRRLKIFIGYIDSLKDRQHFSFHPRINDLRAVDWHYYANTDKFLKPTISMRYTGQIRIRDFKSFDHYLNSIQKVRLREYNRSLSQVSRIETESTDISSFIQLYKSTFERQGLLTSDKLLDRCKSIIKATTESGSGNLRMLYSETGVPISGVFVLSDSVSDIYLFGASDSNYLSFHGSTRLLLDSIKESFSRSKEVFDFCGMNSPNRGYFKSTFNARVTPYFELNLDRL